MTSESIYLGYFLDGRSQANQIHEETKDIPETTEKNHTVATKVIDLLNDRNVSLYDKLGCIRRLSDEERTALSRAMKQAKIDNTITDNTIDGIFKKEIKSWWSWLGITGYVEPVQKFRDTALAIKAISIDVLKKQVEEMLKAKQEIRLTPEGTLNYKPMLTTVQPASSESSTTTAATTTVVSQIIQQPTTVPETAFDTKIPIEKECKYAGWVKGREYWVPPRPIEHLSLTGDALEAAKKGRGDKIWNEEFDENTHPNMIPGPNGYLIKSPKAPPQKPVPAQQPTSEKIGDLIATTPEKKLPSPRIHIRSDKTKIISEQAANLPQVAVAPAIVVIPQDRPWPQQSEIDTVLKKFYEQVLSKVDHDATSPIHTNQNFLLDTQLKDDAKDKCRAILTRELSLNFIEFLQKNPDLIPRNITKVAWDKYLLNSQNLIKTLPLPSAEAQPPVAEEPVVTWPVGVERESLEKFIQKTFVDHPKQILSQPSGWTDKVIIPKEVIQHGVINNILNGFRKDFMIQLGGQDEIDNKTGAPYQLEEKTINQLATSLGIDNNDGLMGAQKNTLQEIRNYIISLRNKIDRKEGTLAVNQEKLTNLISYLFVHYLIKNLDKYLGNFPAGYNSEDEWLPYLNGMKNFLTIRIGKTITTTKQDAETPPIPNAPADFSTDQDLSTFIKNKYVEQERNRQGIFKEVKGGKQDQRTVLATSTKQFDVSEISKQKLTKVEPQQSKTQQGTQQVDLTGTLKHRTPDKKPSTTATEGTTPTLAAQLKSSTKPATEQPKPGTYEYYSAELNKLWNLIDNVNKNTDSIAKKKADAAHILDDAEALNQEMDKQNISNRELLKGGLLKSIQDTATEIKNLKPTPPKTK